MSSPAAGARTRKASRTEPKRAAGGAPGAGAGWTEYSLPERCALRTLFLAGASVACPRCDHEVELQPASRDRRGDRPCARGYDVTCHSCQSYYLCLRPYDDGARRSRLRRLARAVLQA